MTETLKYVGTRGPRADGLDKVTGRARFGADIHASNMLIGKVLRSPHPHARILSIDVSKALELPGVKAVATSADFAEMVSEFVPNGELTINYFDMTRNIMAQDKVLYDGHAVAALAATTGAIAEKALSLIAVEYEVLPHVIDLHEAMRPDAPVLHPDMFTSNVDPVPDKPSNLSKRVEFGHGDVEAGFAKADVIVEREFDTKPVHQGYIEPHACLADVREDGQAELWTSTQGHFVVQMYCAKLLGWEASRIRVTASEIGGGFGGKTAMYLEPLALILSGKASQPVKMEMDRKDVFRATGPTSGTHIKIKIGATRDGHITAADGLLYYQAGAFQGSPVALGAMCAFAPYDLENVRTVGYDVVSNRAKVAAYRAPGGPMAVYAAECTLDELAEKIGMDPLEIRIKNAVTAGTQSSYGPKFGVIGCEETLEAAKNHPHYSAPLGPNQGRGVATGFWFNFGGETSVTINIGPGGAVALILGTPDIGGSRAAMCLIAAEEFGIDAELIRPVIGDTGSLGYNFVTGGSRVTYSCGQAVVDAARDIIRQLCARAAKIWDIPVEAVDWKQGEARPAGDNAGNFEPLTLAALFGIAGETGGPISATATINPDAPGASFGTHIVDVEVDRKTGRVDILRYTAVQDAGKAIHPSYVEGQMQGGAVQGIGWALNEEYVYGDDGKMLNPGFLDYRMPVCSDLPMIDTLIVEVPNPSHPYGVRGVGETPILPPIPAVANAIGRAIGIRLIELPMSPPKVLSAILKDETTMR